MTRMTPSEAFVETMVANGVTTTFGIMGSAFMDAMDIFAPAGIELVPVVHEQDERVALRRVEAHRAHAAAEGVLELVARAAQPRHLPEHAEHQTLPRRPHRQPRVPHDLRRRPRRRREAQNNCGEHRSA